jgi:hypothetical protein
MSREIMLCPIFYAIEEEKHIVLFCTKDSDLKNNVIPLIFKYLPVSYKYSIPN